MHRTLELTQVDLAGSMFSVVCRMCNFDAPLIRDGVASDQLCSVAEITWGLRSDSDVGGGAADEIE